MAAASSRLYPDSSATYRFPQARVHSSSDMWGHGNFMSYPCRPAHPGIVRLFLRGLPFFLSCIDRRTSCWSGSGSSPLQNRECSEQSRQKYSYADTALATGSRSSVKYRHLLGADRKNGRGHALPVGSLSLWQASAESEVGVGESSAHGRRRHPRPTGGAAIVAAAARPKTEGVGAAAAHTVLARANARERIGEAARPPQRS